MAGSIIHPSADVASDAVVGEGTRIWHRAHIREGARIGSGCVISKDVYIDRGVLVGDRVKIQNGVSVYQGVVLEDDVFVGPHAAFTNDLRPRAFSTDWTVVPTRLRRGASVGANATIMCGITLGEYTMVAAGAVLTVDTLPYGLYVGNPARLKGFVSRDGHELEIMETRADQMVFGSAKTTERLRVTFEILD